MKEKMKERVTIYIDKELLSKIDEFKIKKGVKNGLVNNSETIRFLIEQGINKELNDNQNIEETRIIAEHIIDVLYEIREKPYRDLMVSDENFREKIETFKEQSKKYKKKFFEKNGNIESKIK